jgi:hypothetical protein
MKTREIDGHGLDQEAGRMLIVNAFLGLSGRAWVRLTFGQVLACADLLACGYISGSVWLWQYVATYQRENKWQCVKYGDVAVYCVM